MQSMGWKYDEFWKYVVNVAIVLDFLGGTLV